MSALRALRPIGLRFRCQPSEQLLLRNQNYPRVLCAFISSKANMMGYQRPAPFPYKEKHYNWYYQLFDRTVDRFDENTKILVVDGPIGAGKSTFAKKLAEDLDMLYMPEADFDSIYVNAYGYDLRQLNPKLPPAAQYFDVKDFTRNPKHPNAGIMQIEMQQLRFSQYIDALSHLLNTGQGVVLDRSIYSDFVFMEAMHEAGYMSKQARAYYLEAYVAMKLMVKQPHLIIYLDIPVDVVQKRIKERNRDWEVNSPVLNEKYLSSIEKYYKLHFLKEMSVKSEILIYDWSNYGDVEVVVEDIERIDFTISQYEKKFEDWRVVKDRMWGYARWEYTNNKRMLMLKLEPNYLFPELMLSHDDNALREELLDQFSQSIMSSLLTSLRPNLVSFRYSSKTAYFLHPVCKSRNYIGNLLYLRGLEQASKCYMVLDEYRESVPGNTYEKGYNPDMGDSVFWKIK